MPTISACIIAKNEEKTIETLLKSIQNVVDEIIVVDTGSSDNTIDICNKYNVKLIKSTWENDFSKARNLALENSTKQWIIYIDCDEYLGINSKAILKKFLNNKYEAYTLSLVNMIGGQETLESQSLRIFKNRKEYRFKGRIHEQIAPSIVNKFGDKLIQYMPLKLYHTGYEPSVVVTKNKNKRNFEIFESYSEDEKDGFYYYNLGGEYSRAGNLEKACENYKKAYDTPAFENGFREYLHIYLVKALFDQKQYKEALYYCNKGFEKHPNFPDLHFLAATCYSILYKHSKAYTHLVKYIENKKIYGLNYPDFKLDDTNDLNKLLLELKSKSIFWDYNGLKIIIDARKCITTKVFATLADLSDNIDVILSDKTNYLLSDLKNRLYNVYIDNSSNDIDLLCDNCEYVLKLNGNEYISYEWTLKIVEYINARKTSINAYVLNTDNNFVLEKRLINLQKNILDNELNFLVYTS